jgi:hypothetical protein
MNLDSLTQLFTKFLAMLIILIPFGSLAYENPDDSQKGNPIVTYGGELDFNSRYIWRGIPLSKGAVTQPSAWVSAFNFTFSVWGNFVLNNEANQGEFNEVDLILSYSREWKKITVEPLVQFYLYPNQKDAPATGEGSLKLSYPIIGPVSVFTSHTFDIVRYGGSYFGNAGLSYEHEFNSKLSLESSLSLGWGSSKFNDVYLGLSKSALNVAIYDLSLTYYPKKFVYIRPHVELSAIVDGELRNQLDDSTIVSGGLAVGMEF